MRHFYKYTVYMFLLLASSGSAFCGATEIGDRLPIISNISKHSVIDSKNLAFEHHDNSAHLSSAYSILSNLETHTDNTRRGAKESNVFSKAVNSVVIIGTNEGQAAGSIISDSGEIITNWHVIEGYDTVGVMLWSNEESSESKIYSAKVIHINKEKDLALLKLMGRPNNLPILKIATEIPVIGADVYAIGHPDGERWTYTRGMISQIRSEYTWSYEGNSKHKARIIQTQTPINPGNSGGPLLDDNANIIGVNSFSAKGEGLNFAVASTDIFSFLNENRSNTGLSKKKKAATCDPTKILSAEYLEEEKMRIGTMDINCDGIVDTNISITDNGNTLLSRDTNGDGKVDAKYYDKGGDGKWDRSYYDVDHDGTIDLVGFHPDGEIEASSYEKYKG